MIGRLLTAIAVVFLTATAAQAQNVWSAPGSACVPTGDTNGRYETSIAFVRHLPTEVGQIVFTCQMDRFNSGTTDWNLKMTYRDSNGATKSAAVIARVYGLPIGTIKPFLIEEVDSNDSTVKTVNTLASPQFTHTFDFEANSYFVRVTIKRATTAQIAVFYSVVLDGTAF